MAYVRVNEFFCWVLQLSRSIDPGIELSAKQRTEEKIGRQELEKVQFGTWDVCPSYRGRFVRECRILWFYRKIGKPSKPRGRGWEDKGLNLKRIQIENEIRARGERLF
jgi:hypothetical protein